MKIVAAFLLAVLSCKASPSNGDIKNILGSGFEKSQILGKNRSRERFRDIAIGGSDSVPFGKSDACVDVYQKLQKSKIETLEINLVAGLVSAGKASQVQGALEALRIKPTSSFELAYTACSLIENSNYADAEQLLLTARRIGQETLTDDNFADEGIEIELAPISVQLAYVQQVLGKN